MPSRIVVADHHPLWRKALSDLLREHSGVEVIAEATNGRETVECCRRFSPDLLVVEVGMPEVDRLASMRNCKTLDLRFRALLTGEASDVLFHRVSFDRFGKTLA
jgi:two-component system, NarL family, nitrate/nitrite response regulator NarL